MEVVLSSDMCLIRFFPSIFIQTNHSIVTSAFIVPLFFVLLQCSYALQKMFHELPIWCIIYIYEDGHIYLYIDSSFLNNFS